MSYFISDTLSINLSPRTMDYLCDDVSDILTQEIQVDTNKPSEPKIEKDNVDAKTGRKIPVIVNIFPINISKHGVNKKRRYMLPNTKKIWLYPNRDYSALIHSINENWR